MDLGVDFLEVIHVKWAMMKTSVLSEVCKMICEIGGKDVFYHEESIVRTADMKVIEDVYIVEFDIHRLNWMLAIKVLGLTEIRGYWM